MKWILKIVLTLLSRFVHGFVGLYEDGHGFPGDGYIGGVREG